MTDDAAVPNVVAMTKRCAISRLLIPLAFSAVTSLAIAHLVDLGAQTLGAGRVSTVAVVGDLAGLLCCAVSVWLGLRLAGR